MRRVLVPLDGSPLAASILPDAQQLAGEGGELILIRDPIGSDVESSLLGLNEEASVQETIADLEAQADQLREEGIRVETHALVMIDPAFAIDTAIRLYGADIVACSTHGRGPLGRLIHGGVVWRALADSPVPVLVRHLNAPSDDGSIFVPERRIMVPLDGSRDAEQAVPLAEELAHEWHASIWLVHVVSSYPITGLPRTDIDPEAASDDQARRSVQAYLEQVATRLTVKVHTHVLFGPVSEHLVAAVQAWNIGHVVMTSHGKTRLQRVLLGSVADYLIQHLECPIIVVPSHALVAAKRSIADRATAGVISV
jgi:nucleotide-binding universal stress UspA family protein